jgi:hypothetical protein
MAGFAAVMEGVAMTSVYPSGAARTISIVPTMPPAPPLLSTMTGCPSCFPNGSAMMRATTSVEPPGANGTIILTGRVGYAWAYAHGLRRSPIPAVSIRNSRRFKVDLLLSHMASNAPRDDACVKRMVEAF